MERYLYEYKESREENCKMEKGREATEPFTVYHLLTKKIEMTNNSTDIFYIYENELLKLLRVTLDSNFDMNNKDEIIENMCEEILTMDYDKELIKLDVYLHMYYTSLYKENKERYVDLIPSEWKKDKKDDIRKRRKNLNHYISITEKDAEKKPFKIIEKIQRKKARNSDRYVYGKTQIMDFAPNIVRLYYMSKEFRNIFNSDINDDEYEKYKYSNVINFLKKYSVIKIGRMEEIWLMERLLGINFSLVLFAFFNELFRENNFKEIEDYRTDIYKIVKKIMNWKGIYSRTEVVKKLMLICEIKKYQNENVELKCLLEYIQKILQKNSDKLKKYYEREVQKRYEWCKDYTVSLKDLKKVCKNLLPQLCKKRKNYWLVEINTFIKIEDDNKEKRLYALIQKVVLE